MISTNEYQERFDAIISDWLAPETAVHGETVLLMDGNKRYVRRDERMCVTIVLAKDGTSAIDSGFKMERWSGVKDLCRFRLST